MIKLTTGVLICAVACLAMAPRIASAQGKAAPIESSMRRMIGSWHLVKLEHARPDGSLYAEEAAGKLVFTREGTMAVQVMYKDPAAAGRYATNGYEASFGRIFVNDRDRTFTYRIDGALVRSLIGTDTRRGFELEGNRFIVVPAVPNEHFRIVWERD
jgi:hypothetical protein